ncbi:MAG: carboxypeptidase regulatory-like domain-containing protein [Pseudomonadota bacterium]
MARSLALCAMFAAGCSQSASGSSAPSTSGAGASSGTGGFNSGTGGAPGPGSGGSTGGCQPAQSLTDSCVAALTTPVSWAVEIDPPSSSPYAHGQIASQNVAANPSFMAPAANSVAVVFSAAANGSSVPTTANAVLAVPSIVPGRPDLVYQSAVVASAGTTTAMLIVPQDAFSMAATLSLIPLPPSDQQSPVYPFAVMVSSNIAVTLPAGDMLTSGQLLDSLQNRPPATFVAKVFQNGVQVSNAPFTQADGTFQLQIPAAAAAAPLTLELLPTSSDPSMTSAPFTVAAGTKLGTITLPAYVKADSFKVAVANGTTPLSGVSVRAQTSLGPTGGSGTVTGTAQYAVTGTTDVTGAVNLQLLPGSTYSIAATPAPGSPYASQCVPMVKTVSGANSNGGVAPTVKTIVVTMRPVLSGTIRTAGGVPVPNVSVSAVGTPDASPPCAAPATATASTTTDLSGKFQLPLDPGTYQLDYDPPAGSAAPRLTEWAVNIPGNDTVTHDITLPAGALVVGSVSGSKNDPLSSAVVRFFQVRCSGPSDCQGPNRVPPLLIGKALTDAQGRYRMVVPAPAAP